MRAGGRSRKKEAREKTSAKRVSLRFLSYSFILSFGDSPKRSIAGFTGPRRATRRSTGLTVHKTFLNNAGIYSAWSCYVTYEVARLSWIAHFAGEPLVSSITLET